jgi:hypothetical protein
MEPEALEDRLGDRDIGDEFADVGLGSDGIGC